MSQSSNKYVVYCDGASRGNPGSAGAGFIVFDNNGNEIHSASIALGVTTNNVAEYRSLLEAARYIKTLNSPLQVDFKMDSELVVRQLAGIYKVKAEHLKPLFNEVQLILSSLNSTCTHIPRAENKLADDLANIGADQSELE